MKAKRGCGWIPWLFATMSLLIPHPPQAIAAENGRQMSLELKAGESRVIDRVQPGSVPDIRVIDNPHALLLQTGSPGKILLLGGERGEWEISVTQADGRKMAYDVIVHALRDASDPLKSATMAKPSPSVARLDAGNGPVTTEPQTAGSTEVVAAQTRSIAGLANPATRSVGDGSGRGAAPLPMPAVVGSQSASAAVAKPLKYTSDPSVVASGQSYSTEDVAASGGGHYLPANGLDLRSGTSQVIDFRTRLRRISIADTSIADVQVIDPYQLNLIAHRPGFTTLAVWDDHDHYEERQVRVDPTGKQQVMLNTIVAQLDLNNLENQGMNYSAALSNYGVSLVGLPGTVATPYSQESGSSGTSAGSSASLPPGGSIIPLLLSQNLTYGLAAQNSNIATQTFFQFLESHNLGRILAEPRLLANSGEQAKFLSGGEIPIVVAQALNTSIVFKQFGTSVVFVPTVVGVNDIELLVKPEVSEPDYAHGVQLFGFTVPAFVTRRAETMVRLRDGQTLIIAGLILHQKNEQIDKVPYLADIPYLGGLFHTTSWTSSSTDLVIAVTPRIVRPLPPGAAVFQPSSRGPLTYGEIQTTRLSRPDPARPRF